MFIPWVEGEDMDSLVILFGMGEDDLCKPPEIVKQYTLLAGQAGVANAGYVRLAHLVMDSQKCSIIIHFKYRFNTLNIGFTENRTRGSKQNVWDVSHYTMKPRITGL